MNPTIKKKNKKFKQLEKKKPYQIKKQKKKIKITIIKIPRKIMPFGKAGEKKEFRRIHIL